MDELQILIALYSTALFNTRLPDVSEDSHNQGHIYMGKSEVLAYKQAAARNKAVERKLGAARKPSAVADNKPAPAGQRPRQ